MDTKLPKLTFLKNKEKKLEFIIYTIVYYYKIVQLLESRIVEIYLD